MLYYIMFWTLLGFIMHFYIIFGTNLLTRGPAQNCCFFAYFRVPKKRNIKRSPNGMKPSGVWFLERTRFGELGVQVRKLPRIPRDRGPPPVSWDPRASTDVLLPPIYTYVPQKHPGAPQNTISTAVTFCIREIPSWSLHRRSAGGGIDHGGLLHQHHSPSDELWVVYHRPSGP